MRKKKSFLNIVSFTGLLFFASFCFLPDTNARADSNNKLFDMSLEELMNEEIESTSALTQTTRKMQPSTVTTITKEQIASSGARSLDELLDIYVPNLQLLRDHYDFTAIGLRGIMSDRDNKLMILVNGREINDHTQQGALSERDLPMLTDIHHIDVVRGPGSALYGTGALAMVINIVTESADTFTGSQVTGRMGAVEEFYSTEYKTGKKFSDNSGLYLYAGINRYLGAKPEYSPEHTPYYDGDGYVRDNQSHRDKPKYKLFVDYKNGNFDFWARYTGGGVRTEQSTKWWPYTTGNFFSVGYQQLILTGKYTFVFSDKFSVDSIFSYDTFDYEEWSDGDPYAYREDEYLGKILARWNPNERHSVAFGGSISREVFGLRNPGWPDDEPRCLSMRGNDILVMPEWMTTTLSAFGEHQWRIDDKWTSFLGFRVDKNTFTRPMWSPRATLVFTPTDKDTFKFMWSRSVRLNFASEMYMTKHPSPSWDPNTPTPAGKLTTPERLFAYELRYERQQTKNLLLASSIFFHDQALKGYSVSGPVGLSGVSVGNMKTYGIEVEGIYKTGKTEIIFSHSYTKLYDFDFARDTSGSIIDQLFTAEPYGYGKDLAYWSNHQTKLVVRRQIDDKISVDGSLRIYWGYPGAEDFHKYGVDNFGVTRTNRSIFGSKMLLNLGMDYQVSKDLQFRIDGYNLLGLIDDDFNRNLYGFTHSVADARSSAPALGITVKYTF